MLKQLAAPKQKENDEYVGFIASFVRWFQSDDLTVEEEQSRSGMATTQDLHEYEEIARRINEQQQRTVNLLQKNIPLIKARQMELEAKCNKATFATQEGTVDPLIARVQLNAEELSALLRLKGVAGVGPVVKYEKLLEDVNDCTKSQPVIDANFVRRLTLI